MVSFAVEAPKACGEDDGIEDEGHVHMNVDHAADYFAQFCAQLPLIIGVVVDPERHREEEE